MHKNNKNEKEKKEVKNQENVTKKQLENKDEKEQDNEKDEKITKVQDENESTEKKDNSVKIEDDKKGKENKEAKKQVKLEKKNAKIEQKKVKKENKKNTGKNKIRIQTICLSIAILLVLAIIGYVTGTIIKKANHKTVNPVATIEVQNFGTIKVELYPQYAPNTVANFIALANNGFYNGLTFHRTIPDFMIQGGDKNGDGSGNATLKDIGQDSDKKYAISGEFIINGFTQNTLKHERGVISMARSDYSSQGSTMLMKKGYDSASSQFFIMTKDNTSLDGSYAAFGKVTEGMDVVDKISKVEVETRDSNNSDDNLTADRPIDPPVIKSISVETNGVNYGVPKTMEPFDYYSYMMKQYYGSTGINSK